WRDWRSALAIVKPETVVALASCRLSFVLDLEGALRKTWTTRHFKRSPRSDSQDVSGESRLGCTAHPRRTAQTGHRHRREQCQQISDRSRCRHAYTSRSRTRFSELSSQGVQAPALSEAGARVACRCVICPSAASVVCA